MSKLKQAMSEQLEIEMQTDQNQNSNEFDKIVEAIEKSKPIEQIEKLLQKNPSILYARSSTGKNLLMIAAENGHLEALSLFHSKDKKYKLLHQTTPVNERLQVSTANAAIFAARKGKLNTLEYLLKVDGSGTLIKSREHNQGYNLLHCAIISGNLWVVRFLLEIAPSKYYNRSSSSHENFDQKKRSEECLDFLHSCTTEGFNGLHLAAAEGHLDIFLYLYKKWPHLLHARSQNGSTVLMMALTDIHKKNSQLKKNIIEIILNLDPSQCATTDKQDSSVFDYFEYHLLPDIREILHKHLSQLFENSKAYPFYKEILREEKLQGCLLPKLMGHIQCLHSKLSKELNEYEVANATHPTITSSMDITGDSQSQNLNGNAATANAKEEKETSENKISLDCFKHNSLEHNKFLSAVKENQVINVMQVLEQHPELLYVTNEHGNNALMIASMEGHQNMAESILLFEKEKGSEPKTLIYRSNNMQWNAAHFAAYFGHLQLLLFILENDSKHKLCLDTIKITGYNIVQLAVEQGHLKIVRYLLEQHPCKEFLLYSLDRDYRNLVHIALSHGEFEIAQYLLEQYDGAWPEITKDSDTAFNSIRKYLDKKKIEMPGGYCLSMFQTLRIDPNSNEFFKPIVNNSENTTKISTKNSLHKMFFRQLIEVINRSNYESYILSDYSQPLRNLRENQQKINQSIQIVENLIKFGQIDIPAMSQSPGLPELIQVPSPKKAYSEKTIIFSISQPAMNGHSINQNGNGVNTQNGHSSENGWDEDQSLEQPNSDTFANATANANYHGKRTREEAGLDKLEGFSLDGKLPALPKMNGDIQSESHEAHHGTINGNGVAANGDSTVNSPVAKRQRTG